MNTTTSPRRAFTLVEAIVVLVIVGLLAAILFPVVSRVRAGARTSTCTSNLRQIGQAIALYKSDNDGFYPQCVTIKYTEQMMVFPSVWWMDIGLQPPPVCPESNFDLLKSNANIKRLMGSYALNFWLTKDFGSKTNKIAIGKEEFALHYPTLTVVAFDSRPLIYARYRPDTARTISDLTKIAGLKKWRERVLKLPLGATRHQGGANYLFGDGHVKWFRPEQLSTTPKNDGVHPGFGL